MRDRVDRSAATLVAAALGGLGLGGSAVCLHSSLRSFGAVERDGRTVVDAFLSQGCTLLVPTFTYESWTGPPPGTNVPARNAWDPDRPANDGEVFVAGSAACSPQMGAVASAVAAWPGRARGASPGVSFCAVGPAAEALVAGQTAEDPFAPLRALAAAGGSVVLAGVGLERMTLLHAAEQDAGRVPFMRWARAPEGVVPFATGGCSDGFGALAPRLAHLARASTVGESAWTIYPAAATLAAATRAIAGEPRITRCAAPECARCEDAIAGGPRLERPWRVAPG